MATSILIVEDEQDIRELLEFTFLRDGYDVIAAETAEIALQKIDIKLPDMIVVDWMLPGMDGIDLAKRLRRDELTADLPIVMLTARGEEADKLKSFAGGIDDYITKPFSPRELLARVKALLRRSGGPKNNLIEASGICLDLNSYRITINGNEIQISPTEYKLLEVLMRNPDRAFERSQLLDRVWGRQVYVEERTVDVHMLRLRKILKPHGLDATLQTVRGIGYRFTSVS
ncbi:phosphate regulon transcriptional regulator PhoB [bacterium]|jgi:two-component system phosphate regulon response regulator PhoB|nr:phosphate regulon transcriptional regulator PhoB [Gammaproteobacteria bacterium]MDA9999232.1 phosphate regulon transcriptional regulator PhoB [bacterium]MDB9797685.1 phosphate regulon transcriptional regulator PhoB [Pseudomonadales bacterium]MBT3695556.1 phosphate regulon transcriptional regulator PhoB [Gammaproteobacteria bacterium]MBT5332665.1 phosphate regulon transcriptional regulator PhoB [Gammaproteobacteria bacterium]|tara:strand:+ start:14 stop:700 length:687 start_codon:yes stop_codon:yes gene_type:complete